MEYIMRFIFIVTIIGSVVFAGNYVAGERYESLVQRYELTESYFANINDPHPLSGIQIAYYADLNSSCFPFTIPKHDEWDYRKRRYVEQIHTIDKLPDALGWCIDCRAMPSQQLAKKRLQYGQIVEKYKVLLHDSMPLFGNYVCPVVEAGNLIAQN